MLLASATSTNAGGIALLPLPCGEWMPIYP
jgi:hypothetical protein